MPDNGLPAGFQLDSAPPAEPLQPSDPFANAGAPSALPPGFELDEEHYGTLPQQALAGIEGIGKGLAGPVIPALEEASGLTTGADIRAREEANPVTHGAGEAVGFIAPALLSGGLSAESRAALEAATLPGVVGKIGEGVAALSGLGGEGAGAISKIAATGIKGGAELAAIQGNNEISKLVTNDPNQTLGSAAINIGLSGIMGGVGGAALGSISPLWQKTKNLAGVEKLITDYMGETKAIQEAGDPVQSASKELADRMASADQMRSALAEAKPEILAKAMPEATIENAEKINGQIQNISDKAENAIKRASNDVKLQSAVPFIRQDLVDFQTAITNPDATFTDKFAAANRFKQTLDSYQRFTESIESTARGKVAQDLSHFIRGSLEDSKIWGAAGDVQRITNEATTNVIRATKDIRGQVLSNTMGELGVAPEKVQTLINQTNAGKVGRKANVIKNYLDYTQKQADAINDIHLEHGLEAPIASKLNPTPVLDHALNTPLSPGVSLARWVNKNGTNALARAAGEAGAGTVGGGLGALLGHPLLGAWAGEKVLAPIFTALSKPFAENAVNSAAAKGAVDYIGNVVKGQKLLDDAVQKVFAPGAKVLGNDMVPDQESRDKLEQSLTAFKEPGNALNVAGNLGHYLPQHATSAAETAARASDFLGSLKPTQAQAAPLDMPNTISKQAQANYNSALNVAQQPLMVLNHVKDGSLLPIHVQTLKTIYPNLYGSIVTKLTNQLLDHVGTGGTIPYAQRVSLSNLMGGQPLDSTMSQQAMHAVMASANTPQPSQQKQAGGNKKASSSELSQINKVNAMYRTPLQDRIADKRA